MKKLIIVLIVLAVIITGLVIGKNMIAQIVVERGVTMITGLDLRMSRLDIGIFKTSVNIDNLMLYNPRDFEDRVMIDMPNIYVDYDLPAVLKGDVHLYDMRLDLKEFVVVKNKDGKLNLNSLKVVQAAKADKKPPEREKSRAMDLQIDNLRLKIKKVVYKDYSAGAKPLVREFNVNIDESYRNIQDPYSLMGTIVVKALMKTTIAELTNFDLAGLSDKVSNTLSKATRLATDTVGTATKAVGDTRRVVTDTAGKILSLPFGGNKE
jgi:hypothetical protein